MKITVEDGILDLPEGFSFDIEHNHPFYSDAGTASVPVTIPATPENKRILGWPDNINSSKRFIKNRTAFLECGMFRKKCTLLTESFGKDGMSISIALQESEMYVSIQERKLKDLFACMNYRMSKMNVATPTEIYTGFHRDNWYLNDVALFPVATDMKENEDGTASFFIINNPINGEILDSSRTLTIQDSQITVPAGYGISPYLYLWALVQYTFEFLGYEVNTNDIANDTYLKHIVVLNNLADTCCSDGYDLGAYWGFEYADLVPDITVGELIVWLHDKFGIIITHDDGAVDIRTFCARAESTQPDLDLSLYIKGVPTVNYPDPQGINITVGTSIAKASPAAETLEDLRSLYENCGVVTHVEDITGTGLFFVKPIGRYYYSDENRAVSFLGSDAFPYRRRIAQNNVDISPNDEFVPMVRVNDIYMPYIGERHHKYVEVGNAAPAQDIKICYAHFLSSGVFHGSTNTYDNNGGIHTYVSLPGDPSPYMFPSLTPEGIKTNWWELHEKILLNSAPVISVELSLPIATILSSDFCTPKLFNGAKVIVKDLTYSIGDSELVSAKANLQLLPMYDDMIIGESVDFGKSYSWRREDTRYIYEGDGYTITSDDGLDDYTSNDEPDYKPTSAGIKTLVRQRWLKYKYTKKTKKWWGVSTSSHTGTHKWEEYFISESTE